MDNTAKAELSEETKEALSKFQTMIVEISREIEAKKLVPSDRLIETLKEYSPYCSRCEADDNTYLDCSGKEPVIRCLWCKKEITMKQLARRARALPYDYMDRMLKQPAKTLCIEKVGDDVWITNGYLAEIAGDEKFSYPDRGKCKPTDVISGFLAGLDMAAYEPAKISGIAYRMKYGRGFIAELKSENHTTYINEDFIEYMDGIYNPQICGALGPVLVKMPNNVLRRIVLPVRFSPNERRDGQ